MKTQNRKQLSLITISCVYALTASNYVCAATFNREEWSFSLLTGAHRADLSSFHNGLFKSPLMGTGGVITDTVTGRREQQDFRFDAELPRSQAGPKASVELQWHASSRHTLVFGMGSWEQYALGFANGTMPTEGSLNEVRLERRIKLAYSEYSIGWRYTFLNYRNWQFYSRLSAHEIFDFNFREDDVFHYISGSGLQGFQRIAILRARTTAIFLPQFAIGGEWYFQNWFSIGAEAGYLFSIREAELKNGDLKYDFTERDDVLLSGMPYNELPGKQIGYLDPSSTSASDQRYHPIKFKLSGIQAFVRFNFYY